jgi:hypothetical protein
MTTEENDDWRRPFIEFFQHDTLPKDKKVADCAILFCALHTAEEEHKDLS